MAQLDRIAQAAFKKLFGLGHTEVKSFPIGNESDSSAITTIGRDIYTDTIGGSAGAVAGIIVDCTNATDGTATSRLTLTVNPADTAGEGVAYYATVPASHGLLSEINPNTGALFQVGDRVSTIVPKKFGSTWRPIVYAAGPTEIPPLDISDWFLDEKAGIAYFGTAPSSTPVRLGCYVYVGRTVSNLVTSAITALTGDVTATGPGSVAATIANNAVTLAKMADMATASFLGRNTAATGDPEVLSIATAKTMLNLTGTNSGDQTITLTGDVTGSGVGSFAATIANDAVTYAKIQNVTTARLLGRATAGSGDVEEITLGTNLSFTGTTLNAAGGLTDGDKGDITVSGSGADWAIDAGVVTLAKMADMATDSFLGRDTAGTGDPEVLSVATAKTLLNLTGTNSGDQTITLTGDVTGSGTGSFVATIANDAVTLAKMANMATLSVIGRSTAGTGDPEIIDAGSDFQVLRRSGTTLDFGSINLASTNAVTGLLGVANGGTNAGAFTAGSVVFAGASGTYTQSNADFFWDNTKKFLGLGITTPGGVIDITKTLDGTVPYAIGLNVRLTDTPTAAQTDPSWAAQFVLVKSGTQNITGIYIPLRGLETTVANTGTGSITHMAGSVVQMVNTAAGVIAEASYFYAETPTLTGGAATPITTIYGFRAKPLQATGVGAAWAIQTLGTLDYVDFFGPTIARKTLSVGHYSEAALLHIAAGTTALAPLLFTNTSSALLTTPVIGAFEYVADQWYGTIATGTARKRLLMADPVGGLTSGRVPFATTNGRLTDDDAFVYTAGFGLETGDGLSVGGGLFQVSAAGEVQLSSKIVFYNSQDTEGAGVSYILDDVALTGQVANIASTNFTNAGVAGTYRVGYYLACTTAAAGAGTIALAVTYTQGGIVRTLTGVGVLMTSTNKATKFTNTDIDGTLIRLDSGSIAYSITVTGIYSTAAYSFFATLERLS